jgi:hypothetical protein
LLIGAAQKKLREPLAIAAPPSRGVRSGEEAFMSMHLVLACVAVVAALILIQHRPLLFPIIALAVSGIEALMALRVLNIRLAGLSLDLVFGATLIVCGAAVYTRALAKSVVAASTVVAMVGVLQLLGGLHIR